MIVETEGLSCRFGSFYALSDVSISIGSGEVVGLVGENGSGKSTLIKLLTGVYRKTSGVIRIDGCECSMENTADAIAMGINAVHQERSLVPFFDAVDSIYLGKRIPRCSLLADTKTMRRSVEEAMERYGIDIPLGKCASMMTPSERTMTEILRAVMGECRLLILDEPTASLSERECGKIFSLITKLQGEGISVLYVSHRLEEVLSIADRIVVLQNGRVVSSAASSSYTRDDLISLMSGGLKSREKAGRRRAGRAVYAVSNLKSADGTVEDVSFEAREGMITGLFGLNGSGRTETLETLFGLRRKSGGRIVLDGKDIADPSPSESISEGIVLIHEERRECSIVPSMSVRENIMLSSFSSYSSLLYKSGKERADAADMMDRLGISARSTEQMISELSGGNQQKAVFARALMLKPRVLLCDEPTQAVDIRTRSEIHSILRSLSLAGCAVVVVTSDLKEMLEIADEIVVISAGRSVGVLDNDNLASSEVLGYCFKECC